MLTPNHPDDELLAAFAADDADAIGAASLTDHLVACERCGGVVADVRALRASLADLPDVRPHRPLRLLPPVEEPAHGDGLVTWVRRLFAPVVAAGATLALIGAVGTASPTAYDGLATDFGADGGAERAAQLEAQPSAAGGQPAAAQEDDGEIMTFSTPGAEMDEDAAADADGSSLPAERSPWPMVLFTGVALALGALLLRWIVVPRAG